MPERTKKHSTQVENSVVEADILSAGEVMEINGFESMRQNIEVIETMLRIMREQMFCLYLEFRRTREMIDSRDLIEKFTDTDGLTIDFRGEKIRVYMSNATTMHFQFGPVTTFIVPSVKDFDETVKIQITKENGKVVSITRLHPDEKEYENEIVERFRVSDIQAIRDSLELFYKEALGPTIKEYRDEFDRYRNDTMERSMRMFARLSLRQEAIERA